MQKDPIVEEVRKVRREIEAECGNDGRKYYAHLIELQRKYADRLVKHGSMPALTVAEKRAPYGK